VAAHPAVSPSSSRRAPLSTFTRARTHAQERRAASTEVPQMFATQFEEMDARAMFPSFDEPSFKATFAATITVPNTATPYTILFNTPQTSHELSAAGNTATFETTKIKMSSYLVAIAVGHFDVLSDTSANGVQYRIFTPPGLSSWARFALNVTVAAVDFFQQSFNFPYSNLNAKLDQISVAGIVDDGMENQGLITYSPGFLLCNPATCQPGDYKMIALVHYCSCVCVGVWVCEWVCVCVCVCVCVVRRAHRQQAEPITS
jgi:puromycin-sensitive aminopeptidase